MLKEIRVNNYPNKTNPYCNVIKEKKEVNLLRNKSNSSAVE